MVTKTAQDWTFVRSRCWTVQVVEGPSKGQRLELAQGEVSIGSAPDNRLVLADAKVSRHHLRLELGQGGARVVDLDSKNGTFIDQMRLTTVVLTQGAVLALGDSRISLVAGEEEVPIQASPRQSLGRMVGASAAMRSVFAQIERAAATDVPVLIGGETGTGKELVAEALHQHSARAAGPLVIVDCAAIARSLIESELFGHVRGAFTGASADRPGAFERAHGGTLFLDEIGELELELQPRLLRVLESGQVKRVGSDRMIHVEVRVVAATHRPLAEEVAAQRFRADLYYRLAVAWISVPPLRDRLEDLPLLAARLLGEPPGGVDSRLLAVLATHSWPGNVRELRNALLRHRAGGPLLLPQHGQVARQAEPAPPLAASGQLAAEASRVSSPPEAPAPEALEELQRLPYKDAKNAVVAEFTRDYLAALLRRHRGNVSAAAREAKLDRDWIVELARRYGISLRDGE